MINKWTHGSKSSNEFPIKSNSKTSLHSILIKSKTLKKIIFYGKFCSKTYQIKNFQI